ncbi:prephenate dehydratase [Podospora australis]|uniref:prephenate dehydratase n=1 Tax=Podospora australis TaxID=1536484 RepID=A0AAN6X1I2_9PEZI|nr:prephenate dehydratase [Podospora australis]
MAEKVKVAFLGPVATYTHQATKTAFPEGEEKYEFVPTNTIRDVFDHVQSSQTTFGVVPFENSTHGVVSFTLDALADRDSSLEDISICGEVYMDIHHYLLGYHSRPGDEGLGHIKRIYSHPQAFGQTIQFRRKNLSREVEVIDVASTSKAAEIAAQDKTGESAAIAGRLAGEENGLEVLRGCIEDREDNTTRFFVIRRKDGPTYGAGEEGGEYKSLVSFTVSSHETPGALANVLGCFKQRGLNLSSINSVPGLRRGQRAFEYLFFVEFEGCLGDGDREGRVKGVMEDLGRETSGWRLLGGWKNGRGR